MRRTASSVVLIAILLTAAVSLQVWRDRGWRPYQPATPILWLQDAESVRKWSLGFSNVIADLYWIRAVVYFGQQRLSQARDKNYDLLYPYLDFVTALDPRFTTAYRFGALFLSEAAPGGPGRPDLAVKLLHRGMLAEPHRWEYPHDIGFVNHWIYRNHVEAGKWMTRASELPGAPVWLKTSAAAMMQLGDDRATARELWVHLHESGEEWIRRTAELRIAQLDALDAIEKLNEIVWRYKGRSGRMPANWDELIAARAVRAVPRDPAGVPFELDQVNEDVRLSRQSPLSPLPQEVAIFK